MMIFTAPTESEPAELAADNVADSYSHQAQATTLAIPAQATIPATHPASTESVRKRQQVSLIERLIDIVVASTVLLVCAPVIAIITVFIKLGTPGNCLFWQKRVGLGRKQFHFVKFRTLYNDARDRFPELYAYQYNKEQLKTLAFKVENDPRVTPQGRWLRPSTIDELPNFWLRPFESGL